LHGLYLDEFHCWGEEDLAREFRNFVLHDMTQNLESRNIGWIYIWLMLAIGEVSGNTPLERGIEAFGRRDFVSAEREFLLAIREQPSNARAHKFLGMVYAAQERFQLAE
jgi:hypothetical protein